jgi:hypothetical protein
MTADDVECILILAGMGSATARPYEYVVTDRRDVTRIIRCFPHVGEGRYSGRFGGWMTGTLLTFRVRDRADVRVQVDPSWTFWREGAGDQRVKPGAERAIMEAVSTAATRLPGERPRGADAGSSNPGES